MNIYRQNRQFRALANATFLSNMGSVLFNLVFLIYAATLPNKTLALSLVSVINLLPSLFQVLTGYWADQTAPTHRLTFVLALRGLQGLLYLVLALLIGGAATMITFALLLAINLASDLIANYTGSLLLHYERHFLHGRTEYETALGFSSGIGNIIEMVGQAVGASLIVLLHNNFVWFGVINAVSFLLAGAVLWRDRRQFRQADHQAAITAPALHPTTARQGIRQAVATVYRDSALFTMVVLALAVNTLGSAMNGLVNVLVANTQALWLGSFGTTIATVNIVGAGAITLAALWQKDCLRRLSLPLLTAISMGGLTLFAANMLWWQNPWAMLVTVFAGSYPIGKINPRLSADVLSKVNAAQLAATMAVIGTISFIGAPVGNFLFLGLANIVSPASAWLLFGTSAATIALAALWIGVRWHAKAIPSAA